MQQGCSKFYVINIEHERCYRRSSLKVSLLKIIAGVGKVCMLKIVCRLIQLKMFPQEYSLFQFFVVETQLGLFIISFLCFFLLLVFISLPDLQLNVRVSDIFSGNIDYGSKQYTDNRTHYTISQSTV